MSWLGAASEWKQGLSSSALQKVEELEDQVDRLKKERLQKQTQLDVLQQSLEKQKRRVEEETRQKQSLAKELGSLGQACESLEGRNRGKSDNYSLLRTQGADELKKKIEDLESKNRQLESKLSLPTPSKPSVSSNFTGASQSDDFWSHFSSSRRGTSLPQKSPYKVAPVKKAIETSEENPFKTPSISCQQDEYLGKSSKEFHTAELIPELNDNSSYIKELESKLATSKLELEEFKRRSFNEKESFSMDSKPTERIDDSKMAHSLNEELSAYKLKLEQAEAKLEEANVRASSIQNELNCQRHNSEAAKQQMENKSKQRETELLAETVLIKSDFSELDLKVKDLEKKLSQRETLAMATQNSLQSTLDKTLSKLASIESEKTYQISSYNQLEAKLNTLQKSEEDISKMLAQMKQEKDMHVAQVDTLKVKHSAAETALTKVRSQLEFNEQQLQTQKYDLEELNQQKASISKERDVLQKDLQDSINNKIQSDELMKEKVKKAEDSLSELKIQHDTIVVEKNEYIQKMAEVEKNCHVKLESVRNLEEEITNLKGSLEKTTSEKNASIDQLRIQLSSEQKIKEDEICAIKKQYENDLDEAKRKATHALEESQDEKNQEISTLNQKIIVLEKKVTDLTNSESKAKQDKLNCEVAMWELEGKLDTTKESEDKLKKDIENCKVKLKSVEDLLVEKDHEAISMSNTMQTMTDACKEYNMNLAKTQSDLMQKEESFSKLTASFDEQRAKYEEVTAKLHISDVSLTNLREESDKTVERLSNDVQNAQRQCTEAQTTLQTVTADYQAQLTDLTEMKNSLDRERVALSEEVANLENEAKSLKEQIETNDKMYQAELSSRETILVGKQDNITFLENRTNELTNQLSSMTVTNVQREEEWQGERNASLEKLNSLTTLTNSLEENVSEKTNRLCEMEEETNKLTVSNNDLKDNLAELTESKCAELAALNEKLGNAFETIEADASKISTMEQQLQAQITETCAHRAQLQSVQTQLDSQQTHNADLLDNLQLKEERVSNAELQLENSQQSNGALTQELSILASENAKLTATLEASNSQSSDEFCHLQEFVGTALQLAESQYSEGMQTMLTKHHSLLDRLTTVQVAASKLHEQSRQNVGNDKFAKEIEEKNINIEALQTEITNYTSKCAAKDLAVDALQEQVKQEAIRYKELEGEFNCLKTDLHTLTEKLTLAQIALNEQKEKSSDHIHSLSQNLSSVKAQLAEKGVQLKTLGDQCESLGLELEQVNGKLNYETDEKLKVEGEYNTYRDAIRIFSAHSESTDDNYEDKIKVLQHTVHKLQSAIAFRNKSFTSVQVRNRELSVELQNLKDSTLKAEKNMEININNMTNRNEVLQTQLSQTRDDYDRNCCLAQAMTFAIAHFEDMMSKLQNTFACYINEEDYLQISIINACTENIISDKMEDLERMVDLIVEHAHPRLKQAIFVRNEKLGKRVSTLVDNIKCLEFTLENVLSEKKELQVKCEQSDKIKAQLEQTISEMKQIQTANTDDMSKQFQEQLTDYELKIDNLTNEVTSLKTDLTAKETEYQSTLSKLQSSHLHLTQSLEKETSEKLRFQKDQETLAIVEEQLHSSQSDRLELQNQISAYSEAEKSMLQRLDLLNTDNEDKNHKLATQQIKMSELETEIDSCGSTRTMLFDELSASFERLVLKLSNLTQTESNSLGSTVAQAIDIVSCQTELNFKEKYEDLLKQFIDQPSTEGVEDYIEMVHLLEKMINLVIEYEISQRGNANSEKEELKRKIVEVVENSRNLERTVNYLEKDKEDLINTCDRFEHEKFMSDRFNENLVIKCHEEGIQVTDLFDHYLVIKRDLESQNKLVASLKENIHELGEEMDIKQQTISCLETGRKDLELCLLDSSSTISDLKSQIQDYTGKLDILEISLQSVEEKLSSTENINRELQHKLEQYLQEEQLLISSNNELKCETESNSVQKMEHEKIISELKEHLLSSETQREQLQADVERVQSHNISITDTIHDLNINIDSLNSKLELSALDGEKHLNALTTLKMETDSKIEEYTIAINDLTCKAERNNMNAQNKISELTEALAKAKNGNQSLSDKVVELNASISDLSGRLDRAEEEKIRRENEHQLAVRQGDERIIELSGNFEDFRARCKLLEEDLNKLNADNNALSSTNDSLSTINKELVAAQNEANERIKTISSNFDDLDKAHASKMTEYSSIIDDLTSQANKRDARRDELEGMVNEAKVSIKSLEGKLALSCRNLHKMEKQLEKRQHHIDKLNAERRTHHTQVKEGERNVSLAEQRLEASKSTIQDLKLQCEQERKNLTAKDDEIAQVHEKISTLKKANVECKSKITRLQVANKQLQQELAHHRSSSGFLTNVTAKVSEVDSENEIPPTPVDETPKSLGSNESQSSAHSHASSFRRSTRLSLRREGIVEECASIKRPISDSQTSCSKRKVMRIDNSNLEGLPHKIVQGLNNIPEGNESPGIIRRPTTPMKIHKKSISIASRRPLGAIDTNSPVKIGSSKELKTAMSRPLRRTAKAQHDECKTQ